MTCSLLAAGRSAPCHASHAMARLAFLSLVLLLLGAVPASAAVIVGPWGPPAVEEFPADEPPDDPPLPPDRDADATPWVAVGGGDFTGSWSEADSSFTVGTLGDLTVSGYTVIRVPDDADSSLRAHEFGHDSLNHYEYDQNARRKVEEAFRGFVGSKFKGEGATLQERQANALAKAQAERDRRLAAARAAILRQMGVLADSYDRLTNHGTSATVNTLQGIQQAIQNHFVAPPAGLLPREPDPARSSCAAYGGTHGLFEEFGWLLQIPGPGLINETRDPGDPIVGRGMIEVDPFIVIGAQENGTVLLSDTYLRILDQPTGEELLDGYLTEAAYMPGILPGYPGMIQAYLEIPPAWALGIVNPIGSPFLAGMEAAALAGETTMAWLHSPVPMFDPLGSSLMPPEGVPLTPMLGVASPASGAVDPPGTARPGLAASPRPSRGNIRFSWPPIAAPLELEIFDVTGARCWARDVDGTRGTCEWTGRDGTGQPLRAGIYFARLRGAGLDQRARVVITR